MTEPLTLAERQKKVTICEPEDGWTREAYADQLAAYVEAHGREPQTITMHPDTREILGLNADLQDSAGDDSRSILITSRDYDRTAITLYY